MLTVGAKQQTAILATNSRPLAVGLTALLLSIPPIDNVICVNEAAELLDGLAVAQPALIFLDTALAENGVCELSKSATGWPRTHKWSSSAKTWPNFGTFSTRCGTQSL